MFELILLLFVFGFLALIRIRGTDGLPDIFGAETSAKLDALAKHLKIKFKLIPRHYEVEQDESNNQSKN